MNILKQSTLLVVLLLVSSLSFAQRKTVYLEPFKSSANIPQETLRDVRARIYDCITDLQRVTLVDGHNYGISAARSVHANYILRGVLTKATEGVKMGNKEGEDFYEVDFGGTIQLIDVQTGTIISEKSIGGRGFNHIDLPKMSRRDRNYRNEARRLENQAADKSYIEAVNACGNIMELLIDENIKIEVHITGITAIKGNQVRGVTIDRGTYSGVSRGERFTVNLTEYVGSYHSTRKIGEIRVSEQPGLHHATCKVVSGKEEIKQAMDNKLKLTAISRTAKLFD